VSLLALSFNQDYAVWDFYGDDIVYNYKRGDTPIFDYGSFLLMGASAGERQPSTGAYILKRRMLFMPPYFNADFVPMPGDSFEVEAETDDFSRQLQYEAEQIRNQNDWFLEKWWIESVTSTRAFYACRCVRNELNPHHAERIMILKPTKYNDKGGLVTAYEPRITTYARVQPVNYKDVNEQDRKMFNRFYKVWINTDLEQYHRGLVIDYGGHKYQIIDVRSRKTMQDLTELLVAANV